jgi:tetratricopeptide (TPR) repeat protein
MDAQTLYRDGVLALRDKHDPVAARKLLLQSLKLNPDNEMAWLWLSRTTDDPQKKLECVERALRINPQNEQALALRQKLRSAKPAPSKNAVPTRNTAPADDLRQSVYQQADDQDESQDDFDDLLAAADQAMQAGDAESAIGFWVRVLDLQPDHPVAIQNAVRQLFKMGYKDDAVELIDNALKSGTTSVPIYLTAIDLARVQGEPGKANNLREQVALLPTADDALILKTVDYFIESGETLRAVDLLERSLARHSENQALLLRMADMQENLLGNKLGAQSYYNRAAQIKGGAGSKTAEKALKNFTPTITDKERGSIGLAFREALGFGVVFVLLGWQDAGLDLLRMGASRWLGVGLSILGGYLLVTALSAPQQKPLASWFGGKVPKPPPEAPKPKPGYEDPKPESGPIQEPTSLPSIPPSLRALFAVAGLVILGAAFMLIFSMSIPLLRSPVTPDYMPSIYDLISE